MYLLIMSTILADSLPVCEARPQMALISFLAAKLYLKMGKEHAALSLHYYPIIGICSQSSSAA